MKCSYCDFDNEAGAKFCAKCGAQIPERAVQIKEAEKATEAGGNCRYCGFENEAGAKFCAKCGAQISGKLAATESKCKYCGFENEPGAKVCAKCGAQTPLKAADGEQAGIGETVSNAAKKLIGLPVKKLLMVIIPIVAAAAVIVVLSITLRSSRYSMVKDPIYIFQDGDTVTVSSNANAKLSINGTMESGKSSMDGAKAALLTDYDSDSGGTLWFVTASESERIAGGVVEYNIADSGKGVVYFTDYESSTDTASLYLYDTDSKNSTIITDDAHYSAYSSSSTVCISPDGKTVTYVADFDGAAEELTGYIKVGNKPAEKLGDNMIAVAVSDEGKYIYYVKRIGDSMSFYVKSGENENRLIADFDPYNYYMTFTQDYSQLIFDMDDRSYISRNGGERTKISNSEIIYLLMPEGVQEKYTDIDRLNLWICGVNSFASMLAESEEGVVRIDDNYEASRISGVSASVDTPLISEDGKRLIFTTSSGDLCVIDPTDENAQREILAEYVESFLATRDGKTVYYINNYDELWVVKGNGTPEKISDDVWDITLSPKGDKVFFLMDYDNENGGILYVSDSSGKREKVSGADNVLYLWSGYGTVFYETTDSEYYMSFGSETFEFAYERTEEVWD